MDPYRKKSLGSCFSLRSPDQSFFSRSDFSPVSDIASVPESEDERDKLGLTTVYEPLPPSTPIADIVFIHGLGGSSRKTWSYTRDPDHFWPQAWLATDPDFEGIRIHSFGYDADWKGRRPSALNIHDFAQSLIGELKNNPGIRRDSTPIIFVGHSMGGCVAKKAYILGRQDPTCRGLVERVHSMFFLSTPHRGSDLAIILENMSTLAWGKKQFVTDLIPNSNALTEINDAFRHYALDLRLWSFYETLPVKAKLLNRIVVEKMSSTLGYPNEEIAAMNADHRHVCKFRSRDDPNYRLLRNALHTAVDMIRAASGGDRTQEVRRTQELQNIAHLDLSEGPSISIGSQLAAFLGIVHALEDDLITLQVLKQPGSCEWLTNRASFTCWEQGTGTQILWLTGRPAAGKSILSSHVIDRLSSPDTYCSYFFFKYGKSGKSTLSECFLSLAYQMAMMDGFVRSGIIRLIEDQTAWDRTDEANVWRRLLIGNIFKSPSISKHSWVIDGIDECVNFNALFTKKLLSTIPAGLRIFATSRDLEEIGRGLTSLGPRASILALSEDDTLDDMRLFLIAKLRELNRIESDEDVEAMCDRILQKSRGSFLWVRLVLQDFEKAWTEEAMEAVLKDVPGDLQEFYDRILQSIESDPHKKELAKSILTWVILASRPLSIDELRCAIKLDLNQTLQNLAKAVPSLCGQLVFVDQANKVQIIHDTARQFLLEPTLISELVIPESYAHTHISSLLIGYLTSDLLKPRQAKSTQPAQRQGFRGTKSAVATPSDPALLSYAIRFFSEHVYRSASENDDLMDKLCVFLKSPNVLSWIEHNAREKDLGVITRTAMNLRGYLGQRMNYVLPTDPQAQFVESWVVDFIRVAAKFRSQLLTCPSSVHSLIPPLCPPDSVISRTFSKEARIRPLVVKNLPRGTWDDCLIRIDYSRGQTTAVTHGDKLFAVGLSTGLVVVYDSISLQSVREVSHPERIRLLGFGLDDDLLVSCGGKRLIVWNTRTGVPLVSSVLQSPPLAVTFLGSDELLLASQTSELTKWNLETGEFETLSWLDVEGSVFPSQDVPDQPPSRAAFSTTIPGCELLLAVGYRSHPVYIWSPLELELLGECEMSAFNGVEDMVFNPNPEIIALVVAYTHGDICIYNYTTMELDLLMPNVFAITLSCSRDGRTLVTGGSQGVIQVFEFDLGRAGNTVLTPIYRTDAFDDVIRGLAFSFDGLRFVDISRRQCRVWEPAALVRKDNELESTSEAIPLPERTMGMLEIPEHSQITTTLVASKDGHTIFAGKSDGCVSVSSTADGSELGVIYSHARGVSVISLIITESGRFIISADDSGRLLVMELISPPTQAIPMAGQTSRKVSSLPRANVVLDRRFGAAIARVLVNANADRLLVIGRDVDELWELPTGNILKSRQATNKPGETIDSPSQSPTTAHSTFQHPSDSSLFIIVTGAIARVFRWEDFEETTPIDGILLKRPVTFSNSTMLPTASYHAGPDLVIEHVGPSLAEPGRLIIWPAKAFDPSSGLAGEPSTDSSLDKIGSIVTVILGVASNSKLLFIDANLWVCSTELRSSGATLATGNSPFGVVPNWNPSPLSITTESSKQAVPGQTRRHFFPLSEWRDGNNELSCTMLTSGPQSLRNRGINFAFAARHRIIIVQGGMEFSETVTMSAASAGRKLVAEKRFSPGGGSPTSGTTSNGHQWTVVSGSMHRRSSNW